MNRTLMANLADYRNTAPHYQSIDDRRIPSVALPGQAGSVRIIAGSYEGNTGPAQTFTPVNVWDVRLNQGRQAELTLPEGHTAASVVLRGTVRVNGEAVGEAQRTLLERAGAGLTLQASSDATLLVLGGEPTDEPIAGQGPFVMNSRAEIAEAMADFRAGRFGRMAQTAG